MNKRERTVSTTLYLRQRDLIQFEFKFEPFFSLKLFQQQGKWRNMKNVAINEKWPTKEVGTDSHCVHGNGGPNKLTSCAHLVRDSCSSDLNSSSLHLTGWLHLSSFTLKRTTLATIMICSGGSVKVRWWAEDRRDAGWRETTAAAAKANFAYKTHPTKLAFIGAAAVAIFFFSCSEAQGATDDCRHKKASKKSPSLNDKYLISTIWPGTRNRGSGERGHRQYDTTTESEGGRKSIPAAVREDQFSISR